MLAATENAAMGMSLFAVGTLVFACAFEAVPWLNSLLKLVPLPSNFFRQQILVYVYLCIYTHIHTYTYIYYIHYIHYMYMLPRRFWHMRQRERGRGGEREREMRQVQIDEGTAAYKDTSRTSTCASLSRDDCVHIDDRCNANVHVSQFSYTPVHASTPLLRLTTATPLTRLYTPLTRLLLRLTTATPLLRFYTPLTRLFCVLLLPRL
jgi:hypothetical protein